MNISKLAFIISEKGDDIAKAWISHSSRGVTVLDAVGAYSMETKKVLLCALKESEIPRLQEEVLRMDANAFIIYSEAQQIVGKGFRVYR